MGLRVLVVEDDMRLGRLIARALREEGQAVTLAFDGDEAVEQAFAASFDVIVLDLMLPKRNGIEVCRTLRQENDTAKVLMLTARDTIADRVYGLSAGADDYLGKPFAFEELLARVRALGRRSAPDGVFRIADLTIDPAAHRVERGGREIPLTSREFDLLEQLVRNSGQVLRRDELLERIWGADADPTSNVVDTYIYYLRNKVDRDGPPLIHTVRGVGYLVRAPRDQRSQAPESGR